MPHPPLPHPRRSLLAIALVVSLAALGCEPSADGGARNTHTSPAALQVAQGQAPSSQTLTRSLALFPDELVLPWGSADGQVGMVPGDVDRPPFVPLAATLGADGAVFILDQVNARVVELAPDGAWRTTYPAPLAPTALTVDIAGRPMAMSLVNRRLSLLGERAIIEEIELSKALHIGGVHTTPEGNILITNRRQETFRLGQPGQWIAWPDLLKTKREGHAQEFGGEPVQTILRNGEAWLLTHIPGKRAPHSVRLNGTQGVASAVAVASYPNGDVLTLIERWQGKDAVRFATRFDAKGEKLVEKAIYGQPIAFPYSEFVPSDDGALLQILALEDGLHVRVFRVQGGAL